uniref:Caspase a n=1 Tax=Xiphophorus couchianus TaxID=32473 RepID=A0A3B5M091_9TELE
MSLSGFSELFFFFIVYFIADKEISKVRSKFVEKVSKPILKQLLDDLLEDRLLNDGEVESVLEDNTNKADMARCLIDIVRKKGTRGSKMLIDHIKTRDEALHAELFPDSQDQPASPTNKTWSNRLIPVSDSERTEKMNDPDIYKVSDKSLKSRVALLITNRNFTDDNLTRKGAEKDEENMLNLLRSLQYEVVKHNDLTAKDIDKALLEFTRHPKLKETDSVFVVIMSHGKRGLILGVDHKIDKPDEFPIDTIYKYLGPNKCSKLMDKPKVIIIQACRGGGHTIVSDSVVSDEASHRPASPTGGLVADSFRYVHKEKDFISLLSSTPGHAALRRLS